MEEAIDITIDRLLGLLQFSDGLFPAGAYAHSFGLETLISDGKVSDARAVAQVLRAYLAGSVGSCDAIFADTARRYTADLDLASCLELDWELEAIKSAAEIRAASRQLGRQTLRIAGELIDHSLVSAYAGMVEADETPGHHAIVFGMVGGASGWPAEATVIALLYSAAVAITGAATRLVPLGQTQAQRLIHDAAFLIAPLAEAAIGRPIDEASIFDPALEIAAMRHARLVGRLFRS